MQHFSVGCIDNQLLST